PFRLDPLLACSSIHPPHLGRPGAGRPSRRHWRATCPSGSHVERPRLQRRSPGRLAGARGLARVARPALQVLLPARAGARAARPTGLELSRGPGGGTSRVRRRDQEDPDVPGEVARDERAERQPERAKQSPVRPGDGRRADEREVLGHQVRPAVEGGRRDEAGPALHEPAPEELLRRSDREREPCRELLLRPQRTERVDVADLAASARHDLAGDPVPDAEDRAESRSRGEAERDAARSYAKLTPHLPLYPHRIHSYEDA